MKFFFISSLIFIMTSVYCADSSSMFLNTRSKKVKRPEAGSIKPPKDSSGGFSKDPEDNRTEGGNNDTSDYGWGGSGNSNEDCGLLSESKNTYDVLLTLKHSLNNEVLAGFSIVTLAGTILYKFSKFKSLTGWGVFFGVLLSGSSVFADEDVLDYHYELDPQVIISSNITKEELLSLLETNKILLENLKNFLEENYIKNCESPLIESAFEQFCNSYELNFI